MLESAEFLERALVEEGLVNDEQISECRALAEEVGCSIEEAIETLRYVDGCKIALTKAQLYEVPFVDLDHFEIDLDNCRLLPKNIAEQFQVFPLFVFDGVITFGTYDPLNLTALDQVRQIVKCEIDTVQCAARMLRQLIERAYNLAGGGPAGTPAEAEADADNKPQESGQIVTAVNTLLADALEAGASDIHINPDATELHIRFRIDGVLHERQGPPLSMHSRIVQRIKVMAQLDLTQTRRPQDGKFRFESNQRLVDVRTSFVPTVTGENVVLRLLNSNTTIHSFADLGMAPRIIDDMEQILGHPYGILLVTGPTGSGKTTTLYTAVSTVNRPDRNIVTIEDPVEIRVPMVRQMQVNHEIGLTFATALRSMLRQDPDIILVGEIRDEETASIAMQAALTGHLVLSTLHTNDAAGAVARLRDFGIADFIINSALLGILAQRLVRRVCPHCAEPAKTEPKMLERFGLEDAGGLVIGRGCPKCLRMGYQGRVGIYEMLRVTPRVQRVLTGGGDVGQVQDAAVEDGARLLWHDALDKARMGLTTLEEVARVVSVIETDSRSTEGGLRRSA